ncbi:MAG: glycoside hydrolase family 3 protein, partial [Candidatus Gastranaerophilales bacterium]|nr:glycoside hydrolase family 3 protein [Candidatus Gastranaerophilales bacterium]
MKTDKILQTLSLSEKVHQMFILGFPGTRLSDENLNIQKAIRKGIGGVILFTHNIESYEQTAQLSANLQEMAKIPLFVSIDQEGGRVERTGNVKDKVNYLSPGEIAATKTPEFAAQQAEIMVKELQSMGVNMDFAPVLDVNTNPKNPIIGIRSFGDTPEQVIKFAKPVYQTFMANNIVPVVKHFPGHGMTGEDSHLTMPSVDLSMDELERIHIAPFKQAIADGISAIMVSHVHYKAFNEEVMPASLSENVIKRYLRNKLGFEGIVISDDMVMG